jgi:hypothetical protein
LFNRFGGKQYGLDGSGPQWNEIDISHHFGPENPYGNGRLDSQDGATRTAESNPQWLEGLPFPSG